MLIVAPESLAGGAEGAVQAAAGPEEAAMPDPSLEEPLGLPLECSSRFLPPLPLFLSDFLEELLPLEEL